LDRASTGKTIRDFDFKLLRVTKDDVAILRVDENQQVGNICFYIINKVENTDSPVAAAQLRTTKMVRGGTGTRGIYTNDMI
jgi:hypothetical protein